jgi:phenylalanyl-tRNA synthetase beta chain
MPTIESNKKDLEKLIGKKFSKEELEKALLYVKGELDAIEGNLLKIDVKETNRPDLWSSEGIAREIKKRIGIQKGLTKYKFKKSGLKVFIDKSVKNARPFTVSAIAKGVKVTEELLVQLIQLQEKVDGTFGRKRSESSTGIYDFDKIQGNIKYYGANPRKTKFIPLEFKVEMDLDEILEMHPKGKEYSHLLKGKKIYPLFEDEKRNILSMPPIINSNYSGKVTSETKNLFIEVSGFKKEIISTGLQVMVMALMDRGAEIQSVEIIDSGKKTISPEFKTKKMKFELQLIEKITGLKLKNAQIIDLFKKAGMNPKINGKKIEIEYFDYRKDIMHPVDLIEDLLIGYGYNEIPLEKIELNVRGQHLPETLYLDKIRDICIGLELQEILSFNLTSIEKQNLNLGLKEKFVQIANPVSNNWEIMRKRIMPELLEFLNKNKRFDFPQKIFEIGTTLELNPKKENGVNEFKKLCIALSGKEMNFNEIKSMLQAITENLGIEFKLINSQIPFLDSEKQAEIIFSNQKKGFIGELNEKTMKAFGLEQNTTILEIEL